MKNSTRVILIVLGILSIFTGFICISNSMKTARSIAIIGGADGPTSIFITRNINLLYIGIGILFLMLLAVSFIVVKKKFRS